MVKALKFGERHRLRCAIRASKEDQADSGSSTGDSKWSQVPMSDIHAFKRSCTPRGQFITKTSTVNSFRFTSSDTPRELAEAFIREAKWG